MIVAWLDAQFGGALDTPLGGKGNDRWRIAARTAAATGLMDAAVAGRHLASQAEGHRPDAFIERLQLRRARVLTYLAESFVPADAPVTTDAIAVGCALGYLDFRYPEEDWRSGRPALAGWYETYAKRPAMQATVPRA